MRDKEKKMFRSPYKEVGLHAANYPRTNMRKQKNKKNTCANASKVL